MPATTRPCSSGARADSKRCKARRHDSGHPPHGLPGSKRHFGSGDILVMFTDGVTEAVDPEDQDFGEERLANLVAG